MLGFPLTRAVRRNCLLHAVAAGYLAVMESASV